MDERTPGRESLRLLLAKGPAVSPSEFGDPLAAETAVAVCVYDEEGTRVAALEVDRAGDACGARPCWRAGRNGTPLSYRDPAGTADGMRRIRLTAGSRASRIALSASNRASHGENALPVGIAAQLADSAAVSLRVHTSDGGCYSALLGEVTHREPARFRAVRHPTPAVGPLP